MKLKIVVIPDDMRTWDKDLAALTGQIRSVYFFNPEKIYRLCELTPSYELHFLYYQTENEIDDGTEEKLMENQPENPVVYYHCQTIQQYCQKDFSMQVDADESHEEMMENARDYLTANHMV